jgi:hypothetical protein
MMETETASETPDANILARLITRKVFIALAMLFRPLNTQQVNKTLMMETETASETQDVNFILAWLISREVFIALAKFFRPL